MTGLVRSSGQRQDVVIVVSAWIDVETGRFRARLRRSGSDVGTDDEVSYVDSPDRATTTIAGWLGDLTCGRRAHLRNDSARPFEQPVQGRDGQP